MVVGGCRRDDVRVPCKFKQLDSVLPCRCFRAVNKDRLVGTWRSGYHRKRFRRRQAESVEKRVESGDKVVGDRRCRFQGQVVRDLGAEVDRGLLAYRRHPPAHTTSGVGLPSSAIPYSFAPTW